MGAGQSDRSAEPMRARWPGPGTRSGARRLPKGLALQPPPATWRSNPPAHPPACPSARPPTHPPTHLPAHPPTHPPLPTRPPTHLTIPAVTLFCRCSGLPSATTHSPTRRLEERPAPGAQCPQPQQHEWRGRAAGTTSRSVTARRPSLPPAARAWHQSSQRQRALQRPPPFSCPAPSPRAPSRAVGSGASLSTLSTARSLTVS